MKAGVVFLAVACLLVSFAGPASAQDGKPTKPLDPVTAILTAFKTYDIVALGEGNHGNEQGAAFRQALVRDPRFAATVNDIVIESGAGQHQAVADRYVNGEDVPEGELRKIWQDTTAPQAVWDSPIYGDLLRAVRQMNAKLPKGRRIRVLLGDTPIDWAKIESGEAQWRRTDEFTVETIQREVLGKKRKALVVYGDLHFLRIGMPAFAPTAPKEPPSMVALLERAGVKAFSIWTYTGQGRPDDQDLDKLQADVASWKVPSLAMVRGTTLGLTHFAFYFPAGLGTFSMRQPDGSILRISAPAGPGLMQEQFDAVLYLGPTKSITYSRPSAALCADPDYVAMRVRRIAVMAPPPPQAAPTASAKAQRSVSDDMIDAFKARCLAQAQR